MANNPLKIILLYDQPEERSYHSSLKSLIEDTDRPTESHVARALLRLGHQVEPLGLFSSIEPLIQRIQSNPPDLVFNLSETFRGNRKHEANIAGLLEMLGIPFTGSPAQALGLSKNKALAKKILDHDDIPTAAFTLWHEGLTRDQFNIKFPVIVKPLDLEASEGIAQNSVVKTWTECKQRAQYLAERYQTQVIIEQYIEGRELYIGIIQSTTGELIALAPRELVISKPVRAQHLIATYKVKWDKEYRKRRGIHTTQKHDLDQDAVNQLSGYSKRAFKSLGLTGYARFDWRMTSDRKLYLIEANPNPALSSDDDLALAAKNFGWSYDELICKIVENSFPSTTNSLTRELKLA